MFCLMEGRHVHPSTLYPGGVGTVPTVQLFTDYMVRLMKYVEFMKKVVPLHDDLFDFFYEALPGYEKVGQRRILLGCWGSFQNPDVCDYTYKNMDKWGNAMYVTPGIVVDGELVTTNLVDINLGIRILLGSSYYDGWEDGEMFVKNDPLGNPVDQRHPWNQTTTPRPQKRDFKGNYSWVMSPRWYRQAHRRLSGARYGRRTARALLGHRARGHSRYRLHQSHRPQRQDLSAEDRRRCPKSSSNGRFRSGATRSNAIAPALTSRLMPPPPRFTSPRRPWRNCTPATPRPSRDFKVPDEAIGCGFHEAVRGVLSHHVVIRDGKIANYHPYPPTPWNANPRDIYGTPGPYEDAVQNTPIFEENGPENFKGIDIMRAVRSFDPCLPCGVHMYLGEGKTLDVRHSPMFGVQGNNCPVDPAE